MTLRPVLGGLATLLALGLSACAWLFPTPAEPTPVPTPRESVASSPPPPSPAPASESPTASPAPSTPAPPPTSPAPSPPPAPPKPTTDLKGRVDAYLTAVSANGVVTIDVVQFYSGDEAIKQAAARKRYWEVLYCPSKPGGVYKGGSTKGCTIDNDYVIINENPRPRTLPLTANADLKLIDEHNCCDPRPVTLAQLRARVSQEKVLVNLTVDSSGRVPRLHQTFVP